MEYPDCCHITTNITNHGVYLWSKARLIHLVWNEKMDKEDFHQFNTSCDEWWELYNPPE